MINNMCNNMHVQWRKKYRNIFQKLSIILIYCAFYFLYNGAIKHNNVYMLIAYGLISIACVLIFLVKK